MLSFFSSSKSLLIKFSFNLNVGCPKNYEPKKFVMDWVKKSKDFLSQLDVTSLHKKAAKIINRFVVSGLII